METRLFSQAGGSGVSMGRVMAEDAFEAVVGAHHAEIRRYLLRVTARASDADDLSQETFLRPMGGYWPTRRGCAWSR